MKWADRGAAQLRVKASPAAAAAAAAVADESTKRKILTRKNESGLSEAANAAELLSEPSTTHW